MSLVPLCKRFRWGGVLALYVACSVHAGGIYRWVDETGATHFSDVPPAGAKAREIETPRAPPPQAVEEAQRRAQELEERDRRAQKSMQQQAEAKQREKQERHEEERRREAACTTLRQRLAVLGAQLPVAVPDAKGGMTWLTDAQIEQQAAALRQQLRELCE